SKLSRLGRRPKPSLPGDMLRTVPRFVSLVSRDKPVCLALVSRFVSLVSRLVPLRERDKNRWARDRSQPQVAAISRPVLLLPLATSHCRASSSVSFSSSSPCDPGSGLSSMAFPFDDPEPARARAVEVIEGRVHDAQHLDRDRRRPRRL